MEMEMEMGKAKESKSQASFSNKRKRSESGHVGPMQSGTGLAEGACTVEALSMLEGQDVFGLWVIA